MSLQRSTQVFTPLLLLLLVALGGCRSSDPLTSADQFKPSELTAQQFVERLEATSPGGRLTTLSGKAMVRISQPGNSDRGTIQFRSDRSTTLLEIKNRIGIEGGQLYLTPDSILVIDRVEKRAEKAPKDAPLIPELQGLTQFNLVRLIDFRLDRSAVERIEENNRYFRVRTTDGLLLYYQREQLELERLESSPGSNHPFATVSYDAYAEIDSFRLPRKISILRADEQARAFILLQQLTVNPKVDLTAPTVPKHYTFIRQ